jgi:hypothetical protein
MKRILLLAFTGLTLLPACNSDEKSSAPASENEVDAARNFLRASLDRKWDLARKYMIQDSANLERISSIEESVQRENREDKRGYHEASITTYDTRRVNDSTAVVQYSNSYVNKKDSLKVVRVNGTWLVDFKYSFLPPDSTYAH